MAVLSSCANEVPVFDWRSFTEVAKKTSQDKTSQALKHEPYPTIFASYIGFEPQICFNHLLSLLLSLSSLCCSLSFFFLLLPSAFAPSLLCPLLPCVNKNTQICFKSSVSKQCFGLVSADPHCCFPCPRHVQTKVASNAVYLRRATCDVCTHHVRRKEQIQTSHQTDCKRS